MSENSPKTVFDPATGETLRLDKGMSWYYIVNADGTLQLSDDGTPYGFNSSNVASCMCDEGQRVELIYDDDLPSRLKK